MIYEHEMLYHLEVNYLYIRKRILQIPPTALYRLISIEILSSGIVIKGFSAFPLVALEEKERKRVFPHSFVILIIGIERWNRELCRIRNMEWKKWMISWGDVRGFSVSMAEMEF